MNILAAFNTGSFNTAFTFALNNVSELGNETGSLFQYPLFESFDTLRLATELTWRGPNLRITGFSGTGSFDIRSRLGYTIRAEKDGVLDLSLSCSFRHGRWGRISLGIASADFPDRWSYSLSWRFQTL